MLKELGYTELELSEKKIEDLLTIGSKIFFQTHFYPLIKIQKKADEIFLSFLTKDKREIPVLLNVMVYEDEQGHFDIHCGGMQISRRNRFEKELLEDKKTAQKALQENQEIIDIREKLLNTQRELELQLQEAARKSIDQTELNKVLTHDLQEPLRKINIYISRLISNNESILDSQTVKILTKITSFSEKMRTLLDRIERFNVLNNKKIQLTPVVLSEVVEKLRVYCGTSTEKIEVVFVDNALKDANTVFNSDLKLVTELFRELIKSAVTFKNPKEDVLKITMISEIIKENFFAEIKDRYHYKNYLRITFESNGIGNFNTQTNVFELFKRFDSTVDSEIGLTYSRRIVQLLNGKITVSSNSKKSTIFTIYLPLNEG